MSKIPIKPFFLLRHGQTYANLAKRTGLDSLLTREGKNQAFELAQKLQRHNLENCVIVHSYLKRSIETARILAGCLNLPLIQENGLEEQRFGKWEGMLWEKVFERLEKGLCPPEGESRDQFTQRSSQALKKVLSNNNSTPIIVAHGGTFFALARAFGRRNIDPDNCQIFQFLPADNHCGFPWNTFVLNDQNCWVELSLIQGD